MPKTERLRGLFSELERHIEWRGSDERDPDGSLELLSEQAPYVAAVRDVRGTTEAVCDEDGFGQGRPQVLEEIRSAFLWRSFSINSSGVDPASRSRTCERKFETMLMPSMITSITFHSPSRLRIR